MDQLPTLFISYSHDNEEHKSWVKKLAHDLRVNGGINVLLDQWNVRLGSNLNSFMRNGLNEARMVLCVCTNEYVRKANNKEGGVGMESTIISSTFSNNQDYIIPIIKHNPDRVLPKVLKGLYYEDFTNNDNYVNGYRKLLNRICDEDLRKIPSIGEKPFSDKAFLDIREKTHVEKTSYSNPEFSAIVTFNYGSNDGRYVIGSGDYTFTTEWSKCGNDSVHAYSYSQDIDKLGHRQNVKDIPLATKGISEIDLDFTSKSKSPKIDEIVVWINKSGKFAATKVIDVKRDQEMLTFEYKIYTD